MFNYFVSSDANISIDVKPSNKTLQAIDVLKRFMDHFDLGIYDGCIYRKPPEAKFTFVFCSSVSSFVHYVLGNKEIANAIAGQISNIIALLSVPSCRLLKPLEMNFNYIEVLPYGTVFNIEKKCFELDPEDLKGRNASIFLIIKAECLLK